jgi:phage terminase large subunit
MEGITANWGWLDEGGQCSLLTWTVMRSRVSMTGGQILITTTPYNLGWLYQDFFQRIGQDKQLSLFTWRSIDNPGFSKEYYEAERLRLRPEEFARRYMGKFEKMAGLVYDITPENIVEPLDINIKTETRIIGMDWGFRNPAALIVLYLRDNCWYVVDEWKEVEKTNPEIIQVAKIKMQDHQLLYAYPDPAEPDRIEECKRDGIPVMEVSKDIKGGVSYVQELFRTKRLFICSNCVHTLDEIAMYHYPEEQEGKTPKDEPFKLNDHLMDALRYALYSHKGVSVVFGEASLPIKPFYPELGI